MWEESLRLIIACWTQARTEHKGKFFQLPDRPVIPKPLQSPHPPLWMSATSPETHKLAGQFGLGLLSFTLAIAIEEVERRIQMYRDEIAGCNPIGHTVNEQVAVFTMTHCAPTNEEARLRGERGVMDYQHDQIELLCSMVPEIKPGSSYEYYERYVGVDYDKFNFDYLREREMVMVGDPEHIIRIAKRYEAIGIDRLLCNMQFKSMPNEHVVESIRLFGEEVIPAFS